MKFIGLALFFYVLIACNPVSNSSEEINETDVIIKPRGLQAILYLEDTIYQSCAVINVQATILNHDSSTFKIRRHVIQQAILSIRVTDQNGQFMPTIPPAMPPIDADEDLIKIKAGEAYLITYNLDMFSPDLPDGAYQVQMSNIPSNSLSFNIQ